MNASELSDLDIFYGELTVNRASVYARLPRPADDAGLRLTGKVTGPRCFNTRTLPTTSHFCDLGAGPTLLSRALVIDPSYWSADVPSIYDLVIDLRRGAKILATARREIGFKALGVRNHAFVLQGKHWVLRGVCASSVKDLLPREWHAASAVFVTDEMDARLAEASQRGTMAVVELRGAADEIIDRLRILAMFPAAIMAVIHGHLPRQFAIKGVAPNLLLAQPLDPIREFMLQPWAHAIWAEWSDAGAIAKLQTTTNLSVVAVRRLQSPLPIDQARAACDKLQRDLAEIGQFAGYVA
ncbi:MAG: hypothetical protein JF612_04635 [Planctomycetia bacterium]|nr:hypothetical protein [Planctomycetia bacterium]